MTKPTALILLFSFLLLPCQQALAVEKFDSSSFETRFTFTDQEKDAESGLLYYGARYYDPVVGRFTQADPVAVDNVARKEFAMALANPQLLNGYSYAGNNPLKYVDESGEFAFLIPLAAVAIGAYGGYHVAKNFGQELGYYSMGFNAQANESAARQMNSLMNTGLTEIGLVELSFIFAPSANSQQNQKNQTANNIKVDDAFDAAKISGRYNWGNTKTLLRHFKNHGADFGAKDPVDYARKAQEFLENSQKSGLSTKIDNKGVTRIYDSKTNTFGSYNSDGTAKTFFKPPSGQRYFDSQPGNLIKQKGGGVWAP